MGFRLLLQYCQAASTVVAGLDRDQVFEVHDLPGYIHRSTVVQKAVAFRLAPWRMFAISERLFFPFTDQQTVGHICSITAP